MKNFGNGFIFIVRCLLILSQLLPSQQRKCGNEDCEGNCCVLSEGLDSNANTTCPTFDQHCNGLDENSTKIYKRQDGSQYVGCKQQYCNIPRRCGKYYCWTEYCVRELHKFTRCPEEKDKKSLHLEGCNQLPETENKLVARNVWCCTDQECAETVIKCGNQICQSNHCQMSNSNAETVCGVPGGNHTEISEGQTAIFYGQLYQCWPKIEEDSGGSCTLNQSSYCQCPNLGNVRSCGSDNKCVSKYCVAEDIATTRLGPPNIRTRCPTKNDAGCYRRSESIKLGDEISLGGKKWCCNAKDCKGAVIKCGMDNTCGSTHCVLKKRKGDVKPVTRCPRDGEYSKTCNFTDNGDKYEIKLFDSQWCCNGRHISHTGYCPGTARVCGIDRSCPHPYCVGERKCDGTIVSRCPQESDIGCYNRSKMHHGEIMINENKWCCSKDNCEGKNIRCGRMDTCNQAYCILQRYVNNDIFDKTWRIYQTNTTACPKPHEHFTICASIPTGAIERRIEESKWCCNGFLHLPNRECPGKARLCQDRVPCHKNYCFLNESIGSTTCHEHPSFDRECSDLDPKQELRLSKNTWCCNNDYECERRAKFCADSGPCLKPYCIFVRDEKCSGTNNTVCPETSDNDEQCDTHLPEGGEQRLSIKTWCCKRDGRCEGSAKICGEKDFCNKTYCIQIKKNGENSSLSRCPVSNEFYKECHEELSEGDERRLSNDTWCCRKDGYCAATVRMCGDNHSCKSKYCVMERIFDGNQRLINITTCPKDNMLDDVCRKMDEGEERAFNSTGNPKKWCCNMNEECQGNVRMCGSDRNCSADFCIGELSENSTIQTRCPQDDETEDDNILNLTRDLGEEGEVWLGYGKWACNSTECKGKVIKCGDNRRCETSYCIAKIVNDILSTECPELIGERSYPHDDDCRSITHELRLNAKEWCCNGFHPSHNGTCPCQAKHCNHSKCQKNYCMLDKNNGNTHTICLPDDTYDSKCTHLAENGERLLRLNTWCCKNESCEGRAIKCGTDDQCLKKYCLTKAINGNASDSTTECPLDSKYDDTCNSFQDNATEIRLNRTMWCCRGSENPQRAECPRKAKLCGNIPGCHKSYCLLQKKDGLGTTTCPQSEEHDTECDRYLAEGNEKRLNNVTWCCKNDGNCPSRVRICGPDNSCNSTYCIGEIVNGTITTRCPRAEENRYNCSGLAQDEERYIGKFRFCCNKNECQGKTYKCGNGEGCEHPYCLAERVDGVVTTHCPLNMDYHDKCVHQGYISLNEEFEISLGRDKWCCRNPTGECPAVTRTCGNDVMCRRRFCIARGNYSDPVTICPGERDENTYLQDCEFNLNEGQEKWLDEGLWCCKQQNCSGVARKCGTTTDGTERCKYHFCIREKDSFITKCPTELEGIEDCNNLALFNSTRNQIFIEEKGIYCCSSMNECPSPYHPSSPEPKVNQSIRPQPRPGDQVSSQDQSGVSGTPPCHLNFFPPEAYVALFLLKIF